MGSPKFDVFMSRDEDVRVVGAYFCGDERHIVFSSELHENVRPMFGLFSAITGAVDDHSQNEISIPVVSFVIIGALNCEKTRSSSSITIIRCFELTVAYEFVEVSLFFVFFTFLV